MRIGDFELGDIPIPNFIINLIIFFHNKIKILLFYLLILIFDPIVGLGVEGLLLEYNNAIIVTAKRTTTKCIIIVIIAPVDNLPLLFLL